MPRKPVVSRNLILTRANFVIINTDNDDVFFQEMNLVGELKGERAVVNAANKIFQEEHSSLKALSVRELSYIRQSYSMDLNTFYKYASPVEEAKTEQTKEKEI